MTDRNRSKTKFNFKFQIMASNDTGSVLLALLTGAAIGAGVGILYAPDKGSKTRKKIKKKANQAKDDISVRVSRATEELSRTAEAKKEDFERRLEDTISTMSYKADDIIETLEHKLADLKKKNAKYQKDAVIETAGKPKVAAKS